jgi:hypothetical protein
LNASASISVVRRGSGRLSRHRSARRPRCVEADLTHNGHSERFRARPEGLLGAELAWWIRMQPPTRRAGPSVIRSFITFALPLAVVGCVAEGTGVGEAESAGRVIGPAELEWKSDFAHESTGDISGRTPDGTEYLGRYFQVVKEPAAPATVDWEGNPSQYDSRANRRIYTSEMRAILRTLDARKTIWCSFVLAKPTAGLAGGGTGSCQAPNGATIENVVLKKGKSR